MASKAARPSGSARDLERDELHRVAGGRVAESSPIPDTAAAVGDPADTVSGPDSEGHRGRGAEAGPPDPSRAPVLLVGFEATEAEELRRRLGEDHGEPIPELVESPGVPEALELLDSRPVAVLCLGAAVGRELASSFLARAPAPVGPSRRQDVVLAAGDELEAFQELVDAERVFYLSRRPPPTADTAAIVASALDRYRGRTLFGAAEAHQEWALGARSILELAGRLAMESRLERAARATAREAAELLAADTADCRIHDPFDETLWRVTADPPAAGEDPNGESSPERDSTAAGLVGFVARTGRALELPRVSADPRYEPDADNDGGPPGARFLAAPIGMEGQVMAVIVLRRRPDRPPFSESDRRSLELLARQVTPIFGRLVLERQLRDHSFGTPGVFRHEAVDQHLAGFGDRGRPLQVSPTWSRWVFRLLVLVFVAAVIFAGVGSLHEFAEGPAVVRLGDRLDVTATLAGTVARVPIRVGERVAEGDLLVAFHRETEAAELARIHREWELGLVQRMLHPADSGIGRSLASLRAQKQLARSRFEDRSVRAPRGGVVSELRVRPGEHLAPGQVLATLSSSTAPESSADAAEAHIVAFLPGHSRPLLRVGMPLRLELEGYRYAYQHLTVESVGSEVLGPAEARRMLGTGVGDVVPFPGPVVWVRARLPSAEFESDGRLFRYHDGVQGRAEVRVRTERLATSLFPGLKRLFGESHG